MRYNSLSDYERNHLFEHLFASGLSEYIHKILGDFDGKSFCWAAHRHLLDGSYNGYVADLDYGRRCADKGADGWLRLLKYSISASSVTSVVSNLPHPLIVALYRANVSSAIECVEYSRRRLDDSTTASMLIDIAELSNAASALGDLAVVCHEALNRIETDTDQSAQATNFRQLAPLLPISLLSTAMNVANSMTIPGWRTLCLSLLVTRSQEPVLCEALRGSLAALEGVRSRALSAIALVAAGRHLGSDGSALMKRAIEIAKADDDLHLRCRLFACLAHGLPAEHLRETWPYIEQLPTWQRDTTGRWLAREHALEGFVPAFAKVGMYPEMWQAIECMEELTWLGTSLVAASEAVAITEGQTSRDLMTFIISRLSQDFRSDLAEVLKLHPSSNVAFSDAIKAAFGTNALDPWLYAFTMQNSEKFSLVNAAVALSRYSSAPRVRQLIDVLGIASSGKSISGSEPGIAELLLRADYNEKGMDFIRRAERPETAIHAISQIARHMPSAIARELGLVAQQRLTEIRDPGARLDAELLLISSISTDDRRARLIAIRDENQRVNDQSQRTKFVRSFRPSSKVSVRASRPKPRLDHQESSRDAALRAVTPEQYNQLLKRMSVIPTLSITGPYDYPAEQDTAIAELFDELVSFSLFEEAARVGAMAKSRAFGQPREYLEKLVEAGGYRAALDHIHVLGGPSELARLIPKYPASYHHELAIIIGEMPRVEAGPATESLCDCYPAFSVGRILLGIVVTLPDATIAARCMSALLPSWLDWVDHNPDEAVDEFREIIWSLSRYPRLFFLSALIGLRPVLKRVAPIQVSDSAGAILRQCASAWP